MKLFSKSKQTEYLNPVYSQDFPDPFVLKYCGEYWAYCTGLQADGRCFGLLHSTDLVEWHYLGGVLEPLAESWSCYWAPEVSYYNGRFYMYYSVGDEEQMQIRVALSDQPAGPFIDSGYRLTRQQFAIDAHLFCDDDGQRYLFYATDFLEHTHIGTGTVVDRLLNPFTPEGTPRPVVRANYDWQVYDPQRLTKGGVRWHTVEGPFVLKRKGLYYEMFSGGNWQNLTYGVSYAHSSSVVNPGEWRQVADGITVGPVLRTIPGKVIGPGHNSVVRGPDNRQLYCIYHQWSADQTGRILSIDVQDWAGERLLILGPTTSPQSVPNQPTVKGFRQASWQSLAGNWRINAAGNIARLEASNNHQKAQARFKLDWANFLLELGLQANASCQSWGLTFTNTKDKEFICSFDPIKKQFAISANSTKGNFLILQKNLPADFNPTTYHLLKIELNSNWISCWLDDVRYLSTRLEFEPSQLGLFVENGGLECRGFELTAGWEDLFYWPEKRFSHLVPSDFGWQTSASWQVSNNELLSPVAQPQGIITKRMPLEAYELVINARLLDSSVLDGYAIYLGWQDLTQPGLCLQLHKAPGGWELLVNDLPFASFPAMFDPLVYQQFRLRKIANRLIVCWEKSLLGELAANAEASSIGLSGGAGQSAFDMVRVTVLTS